MSFIFPALGSTEARAEILRDGIQICGVLGSGCAALGYSQGKSGSEGLQKVELKEVTAQDLWTTAHQSEETFLYSDLIWRHSCGPIRPVFPAEFGLVLRESTKSKLAWRGLYIPDRFHCSFQT